MREPVRPFWGWGWEALGFGVMIALFWRMLSESQRRKIGLSANPSKTQQGALFCSMGIFSNPPCLWGH